MCLAGLILNYILNKTTYLQTVSTENNSSSLTDFQLIPSPVSSGMDNMNKTMKLKNIVVYKPTQKRFKDQIDMLDMLSCETKNCEVYSIQSEPDEAIHAEAIILQGNKIPERIPKRVNINQLFVFANTEPPTDYHTSQARRFVRKSPEYFNLTMTYKFDSDIWLPYGRVLSGSNDTNATRLKNYDTIFDIKTKNVFWLNSHCPTTSQRERYVDRMKNITHVDIYGECGESKERLENIGEKHFSRDYKFYLAFENSMCDDYITEKFFNWFYKDVIVVVRGGANYSKYLPEETYINAANFPNPEALSEFLNELGSDKKRYTDYLRRKDQFRVNLERQNVQDAFCALCWRLNNMDKYLPTWQTDIKSWWFDSCRDPSDL